MIARDLFDARMLKNYTALVRFLQRAVSGFSFLPKPVME